MKNIILWVVLISTVLILIMFAVSFDRKNDVKNVISKVDFLSLQSDDHVKGGINAPVVIIEYSDFQCPACSRAATLFEDIEKDYGNRVAFVYRHFPLSMIHRNALAASYATEAAAIQGSFWEMHDVLFARQDQWSEVKDVVDIFSKYAGDIGIDQEQFLHDYESSVVKDRVKRNAKESRILDLDGTPSIFINGRFVQVPRTKNDLYVQIDALLLDVAAKEK